MFYGDPKIGYGYYNIEGDMYPRGICSSGICLGDQVPGGN